jgi:hypothetical protein
MTPRPATLFTLFTALALTACAADKESYPSLAVRPAERVSGTLQPVAPAPPPPSPPSAEALGRIAQLRADAADADRRFQAAAQAAQAPVNAARGTAAGGERWAVAEVALSDAVARHNETLAALAALDQIRLAAQMDGSDLTEIEAATNEVAALADSEDRRLDELRTGFGD